MATAEQIKSLIKSHFNNDNEKFYTVALQLIAHEANKGNTLLAHSLREIIDNHKTKNSSRNINLLKNINDLVIKFKSEISKKELVINETLQNHINLIIKEYKQRAKLNLYGLTNRNKIMLVGPPGTGKTMTAKVLSYELKLPLYIIQGDKLITKYLGESSAKLRQIFDLIEEEKGIYLFDEFDAIGGERSSDNDVGEMRRVLNSFLQYIEYISSDSIIITATNHPNLLDKALFRRFDDILYYDYPSDEEIKKIILNNLNGFKPLKIDWKQILNKAQSLSHAEIVSACKDAVKKSILENQQRVTSKNILEMLNKRINTYRGINN